MTISALRYSAHAAVSSFGGRAAGRLWSSVQAEVAGTDRVFLTFDDGPTAGVSDRLIDLLAAQGAGATFFLRGDRTKTAPGLVRNLADAGHEIGAHGYAHLDAWRVGSRRATEDLERGVDAVQQVLGRRVDRVRPPYGHLLPKTVEWALSTGRLMTMWSVMGSDYHRTATPQRVAARLSRAGSGSILVLHDGPDSMVLSVLRRGDWSRSSPLPDMP